MIWDRERYIAHMRFQDTGRELFCELFGPLKQLEEQWLKAGDSAAERDLSAFCFDSVRHRHIPCNTGIMSGIEKKVLEDNAAYIITRDEYGRRAKMIKSSASLPLPLDYPAKTPEDWEKVKHWYAFSEDRIHMEQLRALKKEQEQGTLILASMPGGFDEPRQLLGEEGLCIALYEEPEMVRDMLETIGDTCLKVFERVSDVLTVDCLCVHEDMAGKSGPLMGPNMVREFIGPYYQKVWDELRLHGASLFSQDSDGDMRPVIDAFLETGLNIMYPFEPGSGMDMVVSRKKYGKRFAVKGGIDKYALLKTKEDIRRELEYKLAPEMRHGGTVFGLDHRIPNGVTMENYRYYVDTCREMLGLEPCDAALYTPHVRMAF